jgi:hypothetical protein
MPPGPFQHAFVLSPSKTVPLTADADTLAAVRVNTESARETRSVTAYADACTLLTRLLHAQVRSMLTPDSTIPALKSLFALFPSPASVQDLADFFLVRCRVADVASE